MNPNDPLDRCLLYPDESSLGRLLGDKCTDKETKIKLKCAVFKTGDQRKGHYYGDFTKNGNLWRINAL
jgi:hypothetical protein